MRSQGRGIGSRRAGTRRMRGGDETAPVGSATGQPTQVQISCRQFVCVRLEFRWAQPAPTDITNIAPAPANAAERKKIVDAIFAKVPAAPLDLPKELALLPCILECECVGIRWAPWPKNQIPYTVDHKVELLQAGQEEKKFTVTLAILAKARHGIGNCE